MFSLISPGGQTNANTMLWAYNWNITQHNCYSIVAITFVHLSVCVCVCVSVCYTNLCCQRASYATPSPSAQQLVRHPADISTSKAIALLHFPGSLRAQGGGARKKTTKKGCARNRSRMQICVQMNTVYSILGAHDWPRRKRWWREPRSQGFSLTSGDVGTWIMRDMIFCKSPHILHYWTLAFGLQCQWSAKVEYFSKGKHNCWLGETKEISNGIKV